MNRAQPADQASDRTWQALCALEWKVVRRSSRIASPASRGLWREISYLHDDEAEALAQRAKKERNSKAEVIRRALRAHLGIED